MWCGRCLERSRRHILAHLKREPGPSRVYLQYSGLLGAKTRPPMVLRGVQCPIPYQVAKIINNQKFSHGTAETNKRWLVYIKEWLCMLCRRKGNAFDSCARICGALLRSERCLHN